MPTPDELNARFAAPGVRFETGRGGLTKAVLTNEVATAEVYLHGAHVTHYQLASKPPALFLSEKAIFQPGKAIRGGVPICFPWFGDREGHPESPAHGFARTMEWEVVKVGGDEACVEVKLLLAADEHTKSLWPGEFVAEYLVSLSDKLTLSLKVRNAGHAAFTYEQALHTYLRVDDVRNVNATGLGGLTYKDKADGLRQKVQPAGPLTITGETDRVYAMPDAKTIHEVSVEDAGRRSVVGAGAAGSTVLWNPWVDKAARMSDFGDEEWRRMLCVETANVGNAAITLQPGGSFRMWCKVENL